LVNLHFECINNTAENKACIIGLKATLKLKIKKIDVYGDSMLIICQVKGQIKKKKLRCYQQYLSKVVKTFEDIEFTHLGRKENWFADALVILVVTTRIDFGYKVQPIHIDIQNFPVCCCSVEGEIDGNPWYYDIKNFVRNQEYLMGASKIDMKILRILGMDFYLDREVLYKRSSDGTLLRCLNEAKARNTLREVHEGI